jgi:hypothetical protein
MTVTVTTFLAPLCSRKGPQDNADGDGFFFVDDGMVAVHHELKQIGIFENAHITTEFGNVPVLKINLQAATQIEFKKIRSTHNNFEGGRVRITGIFDRGYEEIVTIKLYTVEYKRLGRLLRDIGV